MEFRPRLLVLIDRAMAFQVVLIVCGTGLIFGGSVWWMKPALAAATTLLVLTWIARSLVLGRWTVLRSPMTGLGLIAIAIGVLQMSPLPGRLATLVSPRSRAIHALGTIPELARADDPSLEEPAAVAERTPATLDRPATLRWIVGAVACLAVFCACGHFADRLGNSAIVWGSVIAVFFLGTSFGAAQLVGHVSGLYGTLEPGSGRIGLPTLDDLAAAPGTSALRPLSWSDGAVAPAFLARPDRPFVFGSMLGGPGAYLALASLALPLSLGLALQLLAPRGSREGLRARVRDSGRAGLLALLLLTTGAGAILVGIFARGTLLIPFGIGLAIVGLPGAWPSGLKWSSVWLTSSTLCALACGSLIGGRDDIRVTGWADRSPSPVEAAVGATRLVRDFPLLGSGLGTYPTLASYAKVRDASSNTAGSSLLQWIAETGLAGGVLLAVGALWCLCRLPRAIRSVGSADRTLACMLVGTLVCFAVFSVMHWSIELIAIALSACAVMGTMNRWLAGGTDLFVEPA